MMKDTLNLKILIFQMKKKVTNKGFNTDKRDCARLRFKTMLGGHALACKKGKKWKK